VQSTDSIGNTQKEKNKGAKHRNIKNIEIKNVGIRHFIKVPLNNADETFNRPIFTFFLKYCLTPTFPSAFF
jgi:hypothetical protein